MTEFIAGLLFVLNHPLNKGHVLRTLFTLIWWKFNQLWLEKPTIISLTETTDCICLPSSSYGSLIVYTRWPEYHEMKFVTKNLRADSTFIDIGAGIGDYSLLAANQISSGNILAFEPNPMEYTQLRRNVQLNKLEGIITTEQKAVSNKNGLINFDTTSTSELGHISLKNSKTNKKITSNSLDSIVHRHHIKKIDLLKVDVEGAEWLVFSGAKNSLRKKIIPIILFELNPRSKLYSKTREESLALLSKYGFKFYSALEEIKPIKINKILSNDSTQNIIAQLF